MSFEKNTNLREKKENPEAEELLSQESFISNLNNEDTLRNIIREELKSYSPYLLHIQKNSE